MGLGDILSGAADWIQRVANPLYAAQKAAVDPSVQAKVQQLNAADQHPSFFKQAAIGAYVGGGDVIGEAMKPVGYAVSNTVGRLPGAQFLLDLPSRSFDTLFITAAHASAAGYKETGNTNATDWGQFFNRDAWDRAWSSWGTAQHVSAGQIFATRAFSAHDKRLTYGLDPLDQANAKAIQEHAKDTWYGSIAGGAADLTFSMMMPGAGVATGVVKSARAANVIRSAEHADQVASHLASLGKPEDASHSVLLDVLKQGNASPDSLVSRMQKTARKTDGMDRSQLMDFLTPMMERSSDAAKADVANVWAEANKLEDPVLRDQVKINALLAAQGSKTARQAVIDDAPLLAVSLDRMTGAPKQVALAHDLFNARLTDETTVSQLLDQHYGTAADYAEHDALRQALLKAEADAKAARELRAETLAAKPTVKNFDAQRLSEVRANSAATVRDLRQQVQDARAEYKNSQRWASAAYKKGEITDVADFHANLGDKRQRVLDLQQQLDQARSDHNLFHTTPLPGFEELGSWRQDMADARSLVDQTRMQRDWEQAILRQHRGLIAKKRAERLAFAPGLNAANDLLNSIFNLGDESIATGRVAPTSLDAMKTYFRNKVGEEHYLATGDGNRLIRAVMQPTRAARIALSPQARGQISLVEVDLGRRQLADAMARSKVFSPDEIRSTSNELIATGRHARQDVVSRVQEDMLTRIAVKHFDKMAPEDALRYAKELTGTTLRAFGDGNAYTIRHLGEQAGQGRIMVPGVDDEVNAFDEATLRSDLADHAPMLDPQTFDHLLAAHHHNIRSWTRDTVNGAVRLNDMLISVWKHGALLRPGLAVRASLDTELRSLAMMSTGEALMGAINGAAHILNNAKARVTERIWLHGADPGSAGVKLLSADLVPVRVKGASGATYTFQLSRDAAEREANIMAASKGGTIASSLHPSVQQRLGKFRVDRTAWDRYKPESAHWETSYMEHANKLMASPSGRWLMDHQHLSEGADVGHLLEQLKASPDVRSEYRQVAQPKGLTTDQFAAGVFKETSAMFPTPEVTKAALDRRLNIKYLKEQFPIEARFEVPGPHLSAITKEIPGKALVDSMYRLFLDKPDMWLSRNPTMAAIYRRNVQREVKDVLSRMPEGSVLTGEQLKLIDKRARTTAISDVRRTFFDTTRWTGAHRALSRISPFFGAWEDAMMSWGRLIWDDPRRLVRLQAAYNAAGTINPYLSHPLLLDQNGNPVQRGQDAQSTFIAVPFKVAGAQMRIRREALNSIAQGDVWWLPGFGPQATLATTTLLGKAIPHDVALDIVGTDNPVGKQLLRSMYLDGEVPKSDLGSLTRSVLPGYMRITVTDIFGDNLTRNVMVGFNQRVADAQKRGEKVDDAKMRQFFGEAKKAAQVAAIVRLASTSGLGLSGTATVDGQFYVERMHEIQGMKPADLKALGYNSPEEYFNHLYPDAADLNWRLSKNETGISATVDAQKSSVRLGGLLAKYPKDVGWMVLGASNVGGEFSRTAYNQQVSDGDRTIPSYKDMQQQTQAAVGWKRYQNMVQLLADAQKQYGLNTAQTSAIKSAIQQYIAKDNSAWWTDFNSRTEKFPILLNQAEKMSADPRLAGRSDFVAFRDYMQARQEVLDHFGRRSLAGTSVEAQQARAVAKALGEQLAARDFGFQQMWQRFLSSEVD